MENAMPWMCEVLLMIWTFTVELESGMFNSGGGLTVDAMIYWSVRVMVRCMRDALKGNIEITKGSSKVEYN